MSANGFGYVEIENGKVKAVVGESSNPTIHYFENEKFVKALELHEMILGNNPSLWVYTKTDHQNAQKNGHIVHLLDSYIKDLELLARLLPTSGIENKEIIKPAVDDVLTRLYKIREAKP